MSNEKVSKFKTQITTISVAVSLLLTIGGVVVGILNYYTLNQLQPISSRITTIEATQDKVSDELIIYKATQLLLLDKLATREQINNILGQLKDINNKLNYLYQIHLK
jgi:hypothetical protein